LVTGSIPVAATFFLSVIVSSDLSERGNPPKNHLPACHCEGEARGNLSSNNSTTLIMTNRYCQAVGCYDAVEAHKRFGPVDGLVR